MQQLRFSQTGLVKLVLNFGMLFISIMTYYLAPTNYNYNYCSFVLLLYILFNFVAYFNGVFRDGAGFEYFFMLAFMMTNFIYPVFYYLDDPDVGFFFLAFDHNIITKCTALALLAYSCYLLGVTQYHDDCVFDTFEVKIDQDIYSFFLTLSLVALVGFMLTGGPQYLNSIYKTQSVEWGTIGVYSYFMLVFSYCNTILLPFFWKLESKILRYLSFLNFSIISIMFLSSGSRMLVVSIFISLIVGYNFFVRRLSLIFLTIMSIVGAFFLYVISIVRVMEGGFENTQSELKTSSNVFDPFMDLIINNRNLYTLIDFVDTNTHFYFMNLGVKIFEIFPFSSVILNYIGVPNFIRGDLPTYLEFGSNSGGLGLGSNMVGEAYLAFGTVGVISIFLLFGFFFKMIKKRARKSVPYFIIFFIITSMAILLTRIPPVISFKILFWPIFLYIIVFYLFRKIRKV